MLKKNSVFNLGNYIRVGSGSLQASFLSLYNGKDNKEKVVSQFEI